MDNIEVGFEFTKGGTIPVTYKIIEVTASNKNKNGKLDTITYVNTKLNNGIGWMYKDNLIDFLNGNRYKVI